MNPPINCTACKSLLLSTLFLFAGEEFVDISFLCVDELASWFLDKQSHTLRRFSLSWLLLLLLLLLLLQLLLLKDASRSRSLLTPMSIVLEAKLSLTGMGEIDKLEKLPAFPMGEYGRATVKACRLVSLLHRWDKVDLVWPEFVKLDFWWSY